METVNRIVVSGLVFGPVEFTEPDRGPAHARFCLSQEKAAGSRRVEHRFHCVAFGPVAMAVAASLAPGVAVVLEGELAEARAASVAFPRPPSQPHIIVTPKHTANAASKTWSSRDDTLKNLYAEIMDFFIKDILPLREDAE